MMISALKMIAERIAEWGECRFEDVERVELRIGRDEDRRDDREVLGEVVGDREGRQRAARDQQLLADLDDVEQLGRVGVEVDHVAGLLGGGGAGVHRHADVGLRQRGRVVGAVAGHGDQLPALLLLADQRELGLGRGLGQVVVDARLGRDGRGRQRVVAGDHHGADAGCAHLLEARADAVLDDVLELDDAEHAGVRRRRPAAWSRRARRRRRSRTARRGSTPPRSSTNCRTASPAPLRSSRPSMSTPLMRVSAENGMKRAEEAARSRPRRSNSSLASTTMERPSGVSSGSDGELRGLGQLAVAHARDGQEARGLAVAERDRAGLVEQQHRDVAGGLDRAARRGEHVAAHEAVHAGDADGREQRADRRRDERDEERGQHGERDARAGQVRHRHERRAHDEEDQAHAREQDRERDLVGRALALGALDERDHAVEERLAGVRGDADDDAVARARACRR